MANVANPHIMAAVVGSAGSGMTTVVEAVLHRAGAIPRPGNIAAGTTTTDFQPEEIARQTTLSPALTYLDWTDDKGKQHSLTLADTPGHPDFIGGVDAILTAADLAVVVVSAVTGVTAGTRAAWAAADAAGVPRIVLVSSAERPQANFRRVLGELREAFGSHLFPIQLPLGEEDGFRGVVGLLGKRAILTGPDGKTTMDVIPADMADEVEELHGEVTEEIVSHYDELLEAYFEGQEPGIDVLLDKLAERVAAGDAVPVIIASGITEGGVDRFIEWLTRVEPYIATKDSQITMSDGTVVDVARDPKGEPLVQVFQNVADPFLGQIATFKVLSGTIKTGDRLRNATTGTEERIGNLFRLRGKEHLATESLSAGDVGAVAKLADTPAGSLLWTRHSGHGLPKQAPVRPPVYGVVLKPVSQADTEKLSTALQRTIAEDPTLVIDRKDGLTILRGLGDTHIAVTVDRLKRIFNVNVTQEPVPVAYLETIAKRIEVEETHKKQSGGSGQFARVKVIVSPLPQGGDYEFIDSVVGGSVPRNFIPAVDKGARMAMERGGPNGFPVVDISVELVDGKAHSVDSNDMAFQTAAAKAIRTALEKAGTIVLEPIDTVTVTVPMEYQGAVMQDLSGRRGRVQDTQMTESGDSVVIAQVPEAELGRYMADLRSFTQGHASLVIEPSHYERLIGELPKKPE
ncbi:MAG: elongation factor G [Promicromonosporaceae bacterium]|nr:elongation factor G [Promicromonosporaceae bacterium]